jgi:hypothetical protein
LGKPLFVEEAIKAAKKVPTAVGAFVQKVKEGNKAV